MGFGTPTLSVQTGFLSPSDLHSSEDICDWTSTKLEQPRYRATVKQAIDYCISHILLLLTVYCHWKRTNFPAHPFSRHLCVYIAQKDDIVATPNRHLISLHEGNK